MGKFEDTLASAIILRDSMDAYAEAKTKIFDSEVWEVLEKERLSVGFIVRHLQNRDFNDNGVNFAGQLISDTSKWFDEFREAHG